MTRRILIRPRASVDLDEQFAYIAEDNFDVALNFLMRRDRLFRGWRNYPALGVFTMLKIFVWLVYGSGQ